MNRVVEMPEAITRFAPTSRDGAANDGDSLDKTGQTILGLLQQAAGAAKDNCQHALGVAHKLSLQLRAAEERIKELESDVRHYKDRADHAEQWLLRISEEIEHRFLDINGERSRDAPARQNSAKRRNA